MTSELLDTAILTLQLAAVTTLVLMVIGMPLAWWLAAAHSPARNLVSTLVAMPLVLPPTVLGFYLLLLFSPQQGVGNWIQQLGLPQLTFSFTGLVIASVIYSLPFTVQPLTSAFRGIGRQPLDAAASLGASPLDRFFTVALPLARPGVIAAMLLTFAHTVGEFGVVLMIGGNIPGETRVMSIAIYDHVEALDYASAHWLSACLLAGAFIALLLLNMSAARRGWRGLGSD